MAEQPPSIPKVFELAWGLDESGTRGPRKGLSLEQVLDAAIAVADADGLAGVSMSRVAKQLGFTTMSLYRYVDSKDTLIQLVSDRIIGRPPEPIPGLPWREAIERWATAEFDAIMAHEWWLDIGLSTPPVGPNNMAWLDAGLAAFEAVPVSESAKLQLVMNTTMYVIGRAGLARQLNASPDDVGDGYPEMIASVLDPEKFPALVRALAGRAFEDDEIDFERGDFTFGLDRLLDGYERYIEQYPGDGSRRSRRDG